MSAPFVAGEWPRNQREVLRVTLDTFNGRDVVDLRAWYRDGLGILRPTRSGLTPGVRHVRPLAAALNAALAEAERRGLVGRE